MGLLVVREILQTNEHGHLLLVRQVLEGSECSKCQDLLEGKCGPVHLAFNVTPVC